MKKEIKQRIEQIKKGKVPEGYLYTKAGILANWDCVHINQIAKPITDKAGNGTYETLSISAGIGFVNQAKKFGKELSGKQYEKYTVLKRGDFSYNKGNSKTYPQGCIYRLKDRETAAVPNVFESFTVKEGDSDYYEQLFTLGFLNKQLSAKINHGVRDDGLLNLTEKDFYSCYVPAPPIAEQTKIAEILMQCDKVIELKQKLIDETKKLKKVLLRKMFPQEGENVPEIRFPGFTSPWEQRKLGELYESSCSGGTPTSSIERYYNGDIPFLGIADIISRTVYETKKHISEEGLNNSTAVMIPTGTVSLAMYASVGKVGITGVPMTTSQAFYNMTFASETVRDYVYTMLEKMELFSEWEPLISTGTQRNLNADKVKNKVITVPSEAEMKLIGNLFTNLDNTITLHQREQQEWQNKKKALMQLLLTGIVRVNI